MNDIHSISDFLQMTGARYRVYDIGRRMRKLSDREFVEIESTTIPAPLPVLRSMCIGLVFWYGDESDEHYVWFLRFPLDESGFLSLAARDEFVRQIVERVQANLAREAGNARESMQAVESASEESRYAYKPGEEQRAAFHARVKRDLGLPPSRYLDHARDYLDGKTGYDQWAFVGIQGIADVCADLNANAALLGNALEHLPSPVLSSVAACIDGEQIPGHLGKALLNRMQSELTGANDRQSIIALVRASAGMRRAEQGESMCRLALESDYASNIELLATIAARHWETLRSPEICLAYLEALAGNESGQSAFNHMLADLLFLPGMRNHVLGAFRNPERSERLGESIGSFLGLFEAASQQL